MNNIAQNNYFIFLHEKTYYPSPVFFGIAMNIQQLKIIRETVKTNFSLTEASKRLNTSQSGVSKHIIDLENELGVKIFVRNGRRILGLTEVGVKIASLSNQILMNMNNIKIVSSDFLQQDTGELVIAATHTQARYVLPKIISSFRATYPKVHLVLKQTSPEEVRNLLVTGEADIGIATESISLEENLYTLPYYKWQHKVVVPKNHELTRKGAVDIYDLENYPIITYSSGYTGRSSIELTFREKNIFPDIVLSALDSDVIKRYVELGLGIGIISEIAFDPTNDERLELLQDSFFNMNTTWIAVPKHKLLRGFAYHFLNLCAPEFDMNQLFNSINSSDRVV